MSPVRDYVGNEIKVGSEIAYASLLGRSAALSRGEVLAIDEQGGNVRLKIQRKKSDGTLEMKTKFIYDPYGGNSHFEDVGPSTAYLKFPSRVVVINN